MREQSLKPSLSSCFAKRSSASQEMASPHTPTTRASTANGSPSSGRLSSRQQSRERLMSPPARPVSRSAGGLGSAGVQHPAHLLTRLHSSDIHSPVSLLSLNGELRSTRSHQKLYRKPYLTVYGNQQWRDKEKLKRPNSAARFLDYMDKEEDDPFRKWKLDYVARL